VWQFPTLLGSADQEDALCLRLDAPFLCQEIRNDLPLMTASSRRRLVHECGQIAGPRQVAQHIGLRWPGWVVKRQVHSASAQTSFVAAVTLALLWSFAHEGTVPGFTDDQPLGFELCIALSNGDFAIAGVAHCCYRLSHGCS